jgi:hypothetical protein
MLYYLRIAGVININKLMVAGIIDERFALVK